VVVRYVISEPYTTVAGKSHTVQQRKFYVLQNLLINVVRKDLPELKSPVSVKVYIN
jgi:hypothetical protein